MSAPLYQAQILRTSDAAMTADPVVTEAEARTALGALGAEFDGLEPEDPQDGIWLVGFTGKYADWASQGRAIMEIRGGYEIEVPQP